MQIASWNEKGKTSMSEKVQTEQGCGKMQREQYCFRVKGYPKKLNPARVLDLYERRKPTNQPNP